MRKIADLNSNLELSYTYYINMVILILKSKGIISNYDLLTNLAGCIKYQQKIIFFTKPYYLLSVITISTLKVFHFKQLFYI